jgi:hypothetical protein
MNWDGYDFLAAGLLILGLLVAIGLVWRFVQRPARRTMALFGLAIGFGLIWAQLAVGLV